MDDLARLYALNCLQEFRKQRTIMFHSILRNVENHNAETQLLEILFMFKTSVDGH